MGHNNSLQKAQGILYIKINIYMKYTDVVVL